MPAATVSEDSDDFDVIVVGGGPAGATTAGLLSMMDHRVLVLEREKFPRYHIGESLITGVLPALERLGVRDRLDQLGFTRKYGGTLRWGRPPARGWRALGPGEDGAGSNTWRFQFQQASHYEYSYQVRRADFDAMLLARARELGARVIEEATVRAPVIEAGRVVGVRYADKGDGSEQTVRARLVVDASGQTHLFARDFDLIEWHEDLRNIAVWTYFQGGRRYQGKRAGDILIESRPNGWFWFIPLSDQTVSVGYVTPVAEYQKSGLALPELFATELARTEEARTLTDGASRVSGFRTIKDWSYTCQRFYGPGWALVGDAAAFVDPLLSTGVTLAIRGADGLAEAVDAALRSPDAEQRALSGYEANYRAFLATLLEFVRFFYDRTLRPEDYWERAQETIDPERHRLPEQDFATMLSGLTGLKAIFEPVEG